MSIIWWTEQGSPNGFFYDSKEQHGEEEFEDTFEGNHLS